MRLLTPMSARRAVGRVMAMSIRRYLTVGLAAAAATAFATTSITVTAAAGAATTPATAQARHVYRQQDLQRDLRKITATGVPGVLADVHIGGRELRGTSGVASLVTRAPVNGNGSSGSAATPRPSCGRVLQLAAEHRLSLDDTVDRWLPGVVHGNGNDGAAITIRELLQHTSGLHNYTDDLQAQITSVKAYRKLEFHQFSRMDLLKIALAHKPYFAPGAGWHYSNTNYILLGMIIEKVTHRPWASEVARPDRGTARVAPHVRAGEQRPAAAAARHRVPVLQQERPDRHDGREHVLGPLRGGPDQQRRRPDPVLAGDRARHPAGPGAAAGNAADSAGRRR